MILSAQCVKDIGLLQRKHHLIESQKRKLDICHRTSQEKAEEKKMMNSIGMMHKLNDHMTSTCNALESTLLCMTTKTQLVYTWKSVQNCPLYEAVPGRTENMDFAQYPLDVIMMISQRSPFWHWLRSLTPVGGSTLFNVAGFGLAKDRHSLHIFYHSSQTSCGSHSTIHGLWN